MYYPLNYDQINCVEGLIRPSTQKRVNNETYNYWCRTLFHRACFVLDIDLNDMFKSDVKNFFYWCLYKFGHVVFFDDPATGLAFQPCTLRGFDFYYRPTHAIVSNPMLHKEFSIDQENGDGALCILSPDYFGIWDIISYYADKLAQLSLSIDMSIINTRFAKIFAARNKAAAQALKKVMDKINSGEPAVILDQILLNDKTDKESPLQEFGIENLKNNYITDQQMTDLQTLLNAFDNEIGIPSLPYAEKKERMIMDEANAKRVESIARCTIWKNTLNESFDVINRKFGTSFHADIRAELKPSAIDTEGGAEDVTG